MTLLNIINMEWMLFLLISGFVIQAIILLFLTIKMVFLKNNS